MLRLRSHPGPEIAEIIQDGPVSDPSDPFFFGDRVELGEKLGLAEVTTIGRILPELQIVGFLGVDNTVP